MLILDDEEEGKIKTLIAHLVLVVVELCILFIAWDKLFSPEFNTFLFGTSKLTFYKSMLLWVILVILFNNSLMIVKSQEKLRKKLDLQNKISQEILNEIVTNQMISTSRGFK